jgi:exopolyphosphatase/guanosine-5'-triphosphate,3'-diphosphate pyrophosphatase
MRFAVLDLGTNTFHLLIAEQDAVGQWRTLVREKRYVKLAEQGIQRISDAAFARGLAALELFKTQLDAYAVPPSAVQAFGTAALRTADNAPEFLEQVFALTGIRPESIPGDREAALIYQGVRQAVPFPDNRVLIMDIGGGSVEFIIADRAQVLWQQSFPIGVAVLYRTFHRHDPISAEEIAHLEAFLDESLADLWAALTQFPAPTLVGASGTFDVIDLFLLDPATKAELYGYIELSAFEPLCNLLVQSTLGERRAMPKLPEERVEMVVVALVLIRKVLHRAGIREIYTSVYALKEGMLAELAAQYGGRP